MTQQQILDRLKSYLPDLYDGIIDIEELLGTESHEIYDLWVEILKAIAETFTDNATSFGISKWESILRILPSITDTLEERRSAVKTKLFVRNKASFSLIKSVAKTFIDDVDVYFSISQSKVIVGLIGTITSTALYSKIRDIITAHISIEFEYPATKEIIGLTEHMYKTDLTRTMKLGSTWHLGVTAFGTVGTEVQIL